MGLFFLIPAVAAAAPLLALPAITLGYGVEGWASVAIGLSIGMGGATVLELGWSVVGPQKIAASSFDERQELYWRSVASKMIAALLLWPAAFVLAFALAPSHRLDAALIATAAATATFASSWVFVGLDRPLAILATDTVPRVLLLGCAAAGIFAGGPLFLYPLALMLAAVIASVLGPRLAGFRVWPPWRFFRRAPADMKAQLVVIVGRVAATGYTSFTVALVSLTAPGAVAQFAAAERVMRMASALLGGFPNRFQSWIGNGAVGDRRRRLLFTIAANSVFGVVSGVLFALTVPTAAHILFVGEIEVPGTLAWGCGAVLASICVSRGLGLALVGTGGVSVITGSIIAAAAVGVPLLLWLPTWMGPQGAVVAELAAELVGLTVQSALLVRRMRRLDI